MTALSFWELAYTISINTYTQTNQIYVEVTYMAEFIYQLCRK